MIKVTLNLLSDVDPTSKPYSSTLALEDIYLGTRLDFWIFLTVYKCAYNRDISYQWDDFKAATNLEKHGIDFADAVSVFLDDLSITVCDERFDEERFITIGLDAFGRVLVVVYTSCGQ